MNGQLQIMNRLLNIRINQRGMTLVEVIISIALIGIIATMSYVAFSTGLLIALKSGDNTDVTGLASGALENKLGGAVVTDDGSNIIVEGTSIGPGNYTESAIDVTVDFKGVGETVSIVGNFITVESDSERNDTSMKAFEPGNTP